jgi:4'-phosphopantetheinyl transferase EntD
MSSAPSPRSSPTWSGLFPPSVVVVTRDELTEEPVLLPEERGFLTRAVPTRLLEFTRGRGCARAALARLGCAPHAIAVGEQREPVWPAGYLGSITHCQGHCAAAVARREPQAADVVAGLGLDVELAQPLSDDVTRMVCGDRELEWIGRNHPHGGPWPRLVFSAKESVYKCLFPLTHHFLDFQDVELVFVDESRFAVRIPSLPAAESQLSGRYALRAGFILTTAVWQGPAPEPAPDGSRGRSP